MAKRRMPLYLCVVDGTFVRCLKNGIVNWGNSQWYAIEDIGVIANEIKRPVHILQYQGDVGHRGNTQKRDIAGKQHLHRWYRIEELTDGS